MSVSSVVAHCVANTQTLAELEEFERVIAERRGVLRKRLEAEKKSTGDGQAAAVPYGRVRGAV